MHPISIIILLVSLQSHAVVRTIDGLSYTKNKWGKWTPIANNKTISLRIPADLSPEQSDFLIDIMLDINRELEACAVVFYEKDSHNNCIKEDGINELCFEYNPAEPSCKDNTCLSWKPTHEGICQYWQLHQTGYKIQDFDIGIDFPLNPGITLKYLIKHEIFHALGFGHYVEGIMIPWGGGPDIAPKQLQNWKNHIISMGGFRETHIGCASLNWWRRLGLHTNQAIENYVKENP